nr:site-specific integrase [Variovorax sp. dw_954]
MLERATDEFRIAGHAYPDFPILLWDDMTGCDPVNEFFRHHLLRGTIRSNRTWDGAGRALYDYFSFLQAHELEWNSTKQAGRKDLLAAYRDYSFQIAAHRESTVRQRLSFLVAFYEYSQSAQLIEHLPFRLEMRRAAPRGDAFLGHIGRTDVGVRTADVVPRSKRGLPQFLSRTQTQALLAAATNPHHRMLIQMAVQSGLRRAELATLPVDIVVNPQGISKRNIRIELDPAAGGGQKTKGSKRRSIWISKSLMTDLWQYVAHHRSERAGVADNTHNNLFLNVAGEQYAEDGKSINRIVSTVGATAGIRVHLHMLRHTYATHTLVELQRRRAENRLEPLVFLQRQLGHASIATTMVYLHLINELADDAVLQYQDELDGLRPEL